MIPHHAQKKGSGTLEVNNNYISFILILQAILPCFSNFFYFQPFIFLDLLFCLKKTQANGQIAAKRKKKEEDEKKRMKQRKETMAKAAKKLKNKEEAIDIQAQGVERAIRNMGLNSVKGVGMEEFE